MLGAGSWIGSAWWRWRIVEYRPGLLGSASRNIDGAGPGVGGYLVGMLALVLLAAAVLFAAGRTRRRLQLLTTAVAAALGLWLVLMVATLDRYAGDSRIADVRPGPAFLLAAGAVLASLLAVWIAPSTAPSTAPPAAPSTAPWTEPSTAPPAAPPAEPERPGRGWFAGLGAVLAGLAALFAACHLPLWRDTYPDGEIVTDAGDGLVVLVPAALVSGLLAIPSLVLTGDRQRAARTRCRRWLVVTAVGCGGLLTLAWLTILGDPYAQEHGLRATRPGEGVLFAYLGHLLLAAGGAVATRRPRGGR
ncbi:hypothetical protein WEI85_42710 [Actinomycetes bacterium KLBMP 9797]